MYVSLPPKFTRHYTEEKKQKVKQSCEETETLKFRSVNCPFCGTFLIDIFEDISGHFAAKCSHCKGVVPINPIYFRRAKRRSIFRKRLNLN